MYGHAVEMLMVARRQEAAARTAAEDRGLTDEQQALVLAWLRRGVDGQRAALLALAGLTPEGEVFADQRDAAEVGALALVRLAFADRRGERRAG